MRFFTYDLIVLNTMFKLVSFFTLIKCKSVTNIDVSAVTGEEAESNSIIYVFYSANFP
jgi:hypothetical protein